MLIERLSDIERINGLEEKFQKMTGIEPFNVSSWTVSEGFKKKFLQCFHPPDAGNAVDYVYTYSFTEELRNRALIKLGVRAEDVDAAMLLVLPNNTIAIVNAENTSVLKQLCNACLRTIPCGLSAHDTLTLTSSTEDSLVVSLQRSLTTFEGATVDPMEIPIPMERFRGLSRYLLMAFCALGCLTGQIQPLMQFLSGQKQPSDPSTDE